MARGGMTRHASGWIGEGTNEKRGLKTGEDVLNEY